MHCLLNGIYCIYSLTSWVPFGHTTEKYVFLKTTVQTAKHTWLDLQTLLPIHISYHNDASLRRFTMCETLAMDVSPWIISWVQHPVSTILVQTTVLKMREDQSFTAGTSWGMWTHKQKRYGNILFSWQSLGMFSCHNEVTICCPTKSDWLICINKKQTLQDFSTTSDTNFWTSNVFSCLATQNGF